jgi:hypothetical protein
MVRTVTIGWTKKLDENESRIKGGREGIKVQKG